MDPQAKLLVFPQAKLLVFHEHARVLSDLCSGVVGTIILLLLPIVVHPSVDRVFSNYVKCTCAVREKLCRFKNSLCTV